MYISKTSQCCSNEDATCFDEKLAKLDDMIWGVYVGELLSFRFMNINQSLNVLNHFTITPMYSPVDDVDNCFILTHGDSGWDTCNQDLLYSLFVTKVDLYNYLLFLAFYIGFQLAPGYSYTIMLHDKRFMSRMTTPFRRDVPVSYLEVKSPKANEMFYAYVRQKTSISMKGYDDRPCNDDSEYNLK